MDKKIKRQLGSLELKAISFFQMKNIKTLEIGELRNALGIARQTEKDLLSKLNKKGLILRLTSGYYLVPDKISPTSSVLIDEMEILFYLMKYYDAKYMISGPTAIYYYGFSTQLPNRIYVYNDKIYGDRQIGGKAFVFMKTASKRLKGAKSITIEKGLTIAYATKARLLIDCIYDWNRYNTIPIVYNWIKKEVKEYPGITNQLVNNAVRYGNKAVISRLGYCLESLRIKGNEINKLFKKVENSKSIIPFIPNSNLKGKVNVKWGLIINEEI